MALDDFFRESAELRSTPLTPEAIMEADNDHLDSWVWTRMLALVNPGIPEDLANWPKGVQAYMATRLFEWETGTAGCTSISSTIPTLTCLPSCSTDTPS
jgi:hypothetical protein